MPIPRAAALLLVVAACAPSPQPVVMAPIVFDSAATARAVAAGSPVQPAEPARPGQPAAPAGAAASTTADDPFYPIDPDRHLPGPNEYRSAAGRPGPAYWQQRADYTLTATLDTAAQSVSGTVTLRYTNNSPDTLRALWLQLDQNLYRPGSKGSAMNPPTPAGACAASRAASSWPTYASTAGRSRRGWTTP